MTQDAWTLNQIRDRIATGFPRAPLFNITVLEADAEHGTVRLGFGELATRPGDSVAGPAQFALADVAIYVLILATKHDPAAMTVDLTILLVTTVPPPRSGRRPVTAEVRIIEETTTRLLARATGTYSLFSSSLSGAAD